ncbi:hypothetical protein DV711_04680 [Motiliproteus coralliicola]|uniref:Uncharacterized protein n=1 Tax=Motiliproteus coralliicola TaxID=2283196 RepID=A0A369WT68_9GAMM|nr:hypothetical protein [Motiliproteus coralliicola]RDE24882.1 hypothetical protein DV711_04680 [Motiliproteus coralliicola]
MEFSEVYLGQKMGALKEVILQPKPDGWIMLLRDEDDGLLPLTWGGRACLFDSLGPAAELAHLIGFDNVRVQRH